MYISIQQRFETQKTTNDVGGKLNFILSFFFLKCFIVVTFITPTCTINIIIVKPYALNVKFQHFIFILRFILH
jgi:hypothetical protein